MSSLISKIITGNMLVSDTLLFLYSVLDKENSNEVIAWVLKEINGYSMDDELPEYRKNNCMVQLTFSGIVGSFQVKNNPLNLNVFNDQEVKDIAEYFNFRDSLSAIEDYSQRNESLQIDLTSSLQGIIFNRTGGKIQATSVGLTVPTVIFKEILIQLKTKLIDIINVIEKSYGPIAELTLNGGDKTVSQEVILTIETLVLNNSITKIGDNNNIENSIFENKER